MEITLLPVARSAENEAAGYYSLDDQLDVGVKPMRNKANQV
jgi:hypothetical protein